MQRRLTGFFVGMAMALTAGSAAAATVSYDFSMNAPNGYPVTDLVLYATDGSQDNVFLSPVELAPSGVFHLSQDLTFAPTGALVAGITKRDIDAKFDIVMFVNDAYATAAVGQRYDELFPPDSNPRHSALTLLLQAAHDGDGTALDEVSAFLRGSDAAAATFDPFGSFSIIQFSTVEPPIGRSVPEPGMLGLVVFSLLGLAVARRRAAT